MPGRRWGAWNGRSMFWNSEVAGRPQGPAGVAVGCWTAAMPRSTGSQQHVTGPGVGWKEGGPREAHAGRGPWHSVMAQPGATVGPEQLGTCHCPSPPALM